MAVEKNIMRPRGRGGYEKREPKEYEERVIEIARVSRVAKGGRRIRFRALVVLGNRNGKIGMGVAKANEVAEAVKKATASAKKHIKLVPIINGTIPHEIIAKYGGSRIMLKPAASGTFIVAGGSVRSVAELVGINDLLAKSLGSSNKINNVTATIIALTSFNADVVEKIRGFAKKADEKIGQSIKITAPEKIAEGKKEASKSAMDSKQNEPQKENKPKAVEKASKSKKTLPAKKKQ
jgi:small subunit ribosomal protein S5